MRPRILTSGFQPVVFALLLWVAAGGAEAADSVAPAPASSAPAQPLPAKPAPLFNDLGDYHWAVSTASPQAQRYFDQGLILSYGFNHAEAERSFLECARLDPKAAMCLWGASYVLGPNINVPMNPEDAAHAYERAQAALELAAAGSSKKEKALTAALVKRYAKTPPQDRAPLDKAYADAMRKVHADFRGDNDVAALFGEALLDLTPWDYWTKTGEPKANTPEILATLTGVLKNNPAHPAAIHFYIHATEASLDPGRAEPYADTLRDLVPGAGHLVHMPAHTYMRVGRYHDAVLANEKGAAADNSYVTQCRQQGVYPLIYVPHNHHFLWVAAAMEGASKIAIDAAVSTDKKTQHDHMHAEVVGPSIQHYSITPYFAYVRFGKWDEILALAPPAADLAYPTGLWHWARAMAFLGKKQTAEAKNELATLNKLLADPALEKETLVSTTPVSRLLGIGEKFVEARLASASGDIKGAVALLRQAVTLEDDIVYTEPPDWPLPSRQYLGAALLAAGQPVEAEKVYREDLALGRNPNNGWSLVGLAASLEAQGKKKEAAAARADFDKAWVHADVKIESSVF